MMQTDMHPAESSEGLGGWTPSPASSEGKDRCANGGSAVGIIIFNKTWQAPSQSSCGFSVNSQRGSC